MRRVEINVTLGHGTDTQRALAIFDAILGNHEKVLKVPHYSVVFDKFSPNGVVFMLRFWVQRPVNILKVRSEIALLIQNAFDEQQLFSPYSRSVEFGQDVGMTASRQTRLQAFYGMPILAAIAGQTNGQLAATLQPVPEENFVDVEEPEFES